MPDVYAAITELTRRWCSASPRRWQISAADPQQREMAVYLGDLVLGADTRVLKVGCGTGAIGRFVGAWPGAGEVLAVDPARREWPGDRRRVCAQLTVGSSARG